MYKERHRVYLVRYKYINVIDMYTSMRFDIGDEFGVFVKSKQICNNINDRIYKKIFSELF